MALKIGDVVKLKSGSPHMTVSSRTVNTTTYEVTVGCQWFVDSNLLQGWFGENALKLTK